MSQRYRHQGGAPEIETVPGRGCVEAWGTGSPAGVLVTGYATGAIYHRVDGGAGTSLYINEGSNTTAAWVPCLTPTAGDDTFTTLTVTALLRGGTSGLTINAKNDASAGNVSIGTGSDTTVICGRLAGNTALTINAANGAAGNATIGGASDSVYLGSASVFGNASAALGLGSPGNSTVGTTSVGGIALLAGSTATGNLGSSAYNLSDIVYMLKMKGVLKS